MPSVVDMNNIFITNSFQGWLPEKPSTRIQFVNRVLKRIGLSVQLSPPIHTGQMTSVEQRIDMFHLASSVLVYDVPGDLVELGCNAGQSAVVFQKILQHYDPSRNLHVYDSFEGLPDVRPEDAGTRFGRGVMTTTQEVLLSNFAQAGLEPPIIHRGWFQDTLPLGLPEQIAFAHLDGDLYESILVSLEYVYPRLSQGAVCLIDDYSDPAVFDSLDLFPGVKRACDEFLRDKPEEVAVLYGGYDGMPAFGSHGFFRKQ